MQFEYWQRQSLGQPLFPDIEWNRPEQKTQAGRLAIIGGNKLGFAAAATAYDEADKLGAGQIRAVLPDGLKKVIPPTILGTVYVPMTSSGGISKECIPELIAAAQWADVTLLIGDNGRNSETAIGLEALIHQTDRPLVITRDAVDSLKSVAMDIVNRDKTTLVVSFAQLQKLFQAVYYPKILSFSMQLMQLVEALHKFTITYPVTIVTFHQTQLIIARGGHIVTQEFDQPMMIWRGTTATRAACYLMWNPSKPLEAIAASIQQ
jgi:NAD(P)H-hydrate repair Nnr-like enzyme with NAD(P)H-hydrate dehydratase domain